MNPEDPCACGHERKWHDGCSRCPCPWFCPPDAPAAVRRAWRADRKAAGAAAEAGA